MKENKVTIEMINIIMAYERGMTIQAYLDYEWVDFNIKRKIPIEDILNDCIRVRIKPEPKLVPFTFEDELLGRKIIYSDGTRAMITAQKKDGVYIGGSLNLTSYSSLISTTKFEDGSPCGKYINE